MRFTKGIIKCEYYKYRFNVLKSSHNIVHLDENTNFFAPIHRRDVKNVAKVEFFLEKC